MSYFLVFTKVSQAELVCSSKESSLKDLQELAAFVFSKEKKAPELTKNTNAEVDGKKKQQQPREVQSNANLSSLAKFLLSRFVKRIFFCF